MAIGLLDQARRAGEDLSDGDVEADVMAKGSAFAFQATPEQVFEALHKALLARGDQLQGMNQQTRTIYFRRGRKNMSATVAEDVLRGGATLSIVPGDAAGDLPNHVATQLSLLAQPTTSQAPLADKPPVAPAQPASATPIAPVPVQVPGNSQTGNPLERAIAFWSRRSKGGKIALSVGAALLVLAVIGAAVGGNDSTPTSAPQASSPTTSATTTAEQPAEPTPDASVDEHTRAYISAVQACQISVGLVILDIRHGQTDSIKLADEATTARDTCDNVRGNLAAMDTTHFDDQATDAWYGVDRYKSGLNAFLAYIDNPEPTKLIEARNKLQEGDAYAARGIREINRRRRVYGLPPIKS